MVLRRSRKPSLLEKENPWEEKTTIALRKKETKMEEPEWEERNRRAREKKNLRGKKETQMRDNRFLHGFLSSILSPGVFIFDIDKTI